MKKVIIIPLMILLSMSFVMAQKQKTTTAKPQPTEPQTQQQVNSDPQPNNSLIQHYATKYAFATRWNDLKLAKDALYDLIVEFPGSDSLIFSLAVYYYQNSEFTSSILVGQDLLKRSPKDPEALELVAASFEALNLGDRALEYYESLYLLKNESYTLYKMAFLQYSAKKYQEAMTNADILLAKPDVDELKVTFNDAQGKPKEYKLRVSLLNLKGLIYKDQGDKVNAKKFFDQTLAIAPDFVSAKESLATLK
ncbi:MAG: hypothetical protein HOP08_02210 [Cyclobacteriaceae bacterium]|nr:hypothetical protein [Cyclobacteriaceae bacterium]